MKNWEFNQQTTNAESFARKMLVSVRVSLYMFIAINKHFNRKIKRRRSLKKKA